MASMKDDHRPEYIHEYLKPRKKYKKVLLIGIAIFVASILLGVSAGVSYAFMQRHLKLNEESQVEMIVIARDEMTETEEETLEETLEETETEVETLEEQVTSSESETMTMESASAEMETMESASETEAVLTGEELFKSVYNQVKAGLVTVSFVNVSSGDLFEAENYEEEKIFGIAFMDTEDSLYILADASNIGITENTLFKVNDQPASFLGVDNIESIMVLRVNKALLPRVEKVPLGNSFTVNTLDSVYLVGAPMNKIGSADAGYLTFMENHCDVTDGYEQKIYTNMYRLKGSSAVLIDENGRIVGWMSDQTCKDNENIAVVHGISPLKYLIEDLCAKKDTAYLGVRGIAITDKQSSIVNIPSGYYVQEIRPESPAYEAGILQGDCILSIGGYTVKDSHSLQLALDELECDETVSVIIRRPGADEDVEQTMELKLGRR